MNIQQYVTPGNVAIAAGVAGGLITIVLIILFVANRQNIAKGVASAWQGTFSQVGLFYFGMGLFMLASIVEAGPVLDKISMHGALWGYGGHLLVFAFDMIAAVCLRARLNAKRVFNDRAARLMMWGIWLPAGVSMVSNLAGAFQGFQSGEFNHLGPVAWILPLVGGVFPSMIVILSLAADNLLDMTAINSKIDPKQFEEDEKKRLRILQIRLKSEHDLLEEEEKIEQIRAKRNRAINQREWFFVNWIRPRVVQPVTQNTQEEMIQMITDLRLQLEQQIDHHVVNLLTKNDDERVDEIVPPGHNPGNIFVTPEPTLLEQEDVDECDDENVDDSEEIEETFHDHEIVTEHTTDPLPVVHKIAKPDVNKNVTKNVTGLPSGDAAKRAQRLLKNHPELSNTEIAKRVKVTASYVSKIRKLMEAEQSTKNHANGHTNGHRKITKDLTENLVELETGSASNN